MHSLRITTFLIFLVFLNIAPVIGETIRIDGAVNVLPVLVDIPPDWVKNQSVKGNGIIYTLRHENSEMEIRSFVFENVDMDYLINAKAARMFAKYSYINILLEKEEMMGDVRRQTVFWKIRSQNMTFYEKTVILQFQNNIVILSCLAPESEYQHHRVVFENAVLSLRYDREESAEIKDILDDKSTDELEDKSIEKIENKIEDKVDEKIERKIEGNVEPESKREQVKEEIKKEEEKIDNKEILKSVDDVRENKINKTGKLKKRK